MPQSFVRNYLHITFSTKNRVNLINPEIEEELHNYLGGTCKHLDCNPILVGGHQDHVHILCLLSQKIALMKLIEEVKSHSSSWIKTKGDLWKKFYWQNGYGAFSVNPCEVEVVMDYIRNQKEHHKKRTFKQEYLAFLKKYMIDYDERYIWD
jgi:putative transposase